MEGSDIIVNLSYKQLYARTEVHEANQEEKFWYIVSMALLLIAGGYTNYMVRMSSGLLYMVFLC